MSEILNNGSGASGSGGGYGATMVEKCNEMSWQKCHNCNFLMDITDCSEIVYLCNITRERLKLTNCKYCDEQEGGFGYDKRILERI